MTFDELEESVSQWHRDRNLIEGSTDAKQMGKLVEEVDELFVDVINKNDLRDELGDCLVVLINLATRNNFNLYEALEYSFSKIKHRKGKMINGVFVKEEDLNDEVRHIL